MSVLVQQTWWDDGGRSWLGKSKARVSSGLASGYCKGQSSTISNRLPHPIFSPAFRMSTDSGLHSFITIDLLAAVVTGQGPLARVARNMICRPACMQLCPTHTHHMVMIIEENNEKPWKPKILEVDIPQMHSGCTRRQTPPYSPHHRAFTFPHTHNLFHTFSPTEF